ncbi:MAG: 23S rRNA (guanosine(2251)-2'-O)-methyltransferase RlmB [Candidatus Schekmanbacteria bacterium RBG_16_38_11]|uniref:23S rRNA (Guanosine(2251)-2'-O)-methyltransferase RlmB n=1 Tax=Candidatus Schekmanbacteria bacterium RBG_16_38_11 TaxID=1817880 RepID=A0A1F7RTP4_9BACT|nr:MAG: 23S rRNA (guanosine(2251)-2'-O)-methyltransferase RlmB [Candidatus Schekmanbacteria bacterium RBG_16_38_11]
MENESADFVYGINPVRELLRAGRRNAKKILIARERTPKPIEEILSIAKEKGVAVEWKEKRELDRFSSAENHQGIVCLTTPFQFEELYDSLDKKTKSSLPPFYIILDKITDPMNFGAIIRSSVVAGVTGIIIPRHDSCPITATVVKASAGAIEYASIIKETNLVKVISVMKEKGIWIFGADERGKLPYTDVDFTVPLALVFGSEGKGISRLIKENCDEIMYIPSMPSDGSSKSGKMISLNVSAAFSAIAFEVARQRRVRFKL